uniref:Uncharacterized protein n=1 Tax=Sphaeramia orbicularis TaxID=375764 RepID=A0A672YIU5_9TELE
MRRKHRGGSVFRFNAVIHSSINHKFSSNIDKQTNQSPVECVRLSGAVLCSSPVVWMQSNLTTEVGGTFTGGELN